MMHLKAHPLQASDKTITAMIKKKKENIKSDILG